MGDQDPRDLPKTFGELKSSGHQVFPVKEELRRNLISRLRSRETLFPGVMGYEDTVVPQLTNAILGSQDIILLGERGQAKSRMVRSLTSLLDEWTPVLAETEIPENPFQPITAQGRQILEEQGDGAPIRWLHRDERYAEKLATPDITIADLIGEVDPIKVAEGRYLSDELTLHYGLVPRVNRGIFAINELPDLSERIQVGLLNLLEERDVQIRGHKVRLPLDVFVVASANPEDYTNRGRIITPLKDRYGAQIRTHYPADVDHEVAIMEQEAAVADMGDYRLEVPAFMKEIIAEITHHARRSPDINQRSGVSVRTSIADYEAMLANAFRRALRLGEDEVVPRISDLAFVLPSFQGKVEFEAMEEGQEDKITQRIMQAAIKSVFDRYYDVNDLESIALAFNDGLTVDTGEGTPAAEYNVIGERIPGLMDVFPDREGVSPGVRAASIEFILEGLHLHKLLNKLDNRGAVTYSG
ncbi:MAG: magnesium chelatase [Pseudomonadales bacterium]|nr:magnesium chelatase [Pseudomonadales bacterium]NIX08653.1 magnesium chelatase [Pseudomonadales bacterium]